MLEFATPKKKAAAVDRERETLFTIDGTDYTIPVRMHPSEMHGYVYMRRTQGVDAAISWAWQTAVSDDGYLLLVDLGAAVSEQAWQSMTTAIVGRFIGLETEVPGPKASTSSPEDAPSEDAPTRAPRKPSTRVRRATAPRRS